MNRLSKKFEKLICLLAVLIAFSFTACDNLAGTNDADNNARAAASKSTLKVEVVNAFRSILPDFNLSDLTDIKLYENNTTEENLLNSWDSYDKLTETETAVDPGDATFILTAKIKNTDFISTRKVTIIKGENTVLFALGVNSYGKGSGNLEAVVTYPKESSDDITVKLVDLSGNAVSAAFTTEKSKSSVDYESVLKISGSGIPTGEYRLQLSVMAANGKRKFSYSDKVVIADGVTSKGTYECSSFVENGRLFELIKTDDGTYEASYALSDFNSLLDDVVKGDVLTFNFDVTSLMETPSISFGITYDGEKLNSTDGEIGALGEKYSSLNVTKTYEIQKTGKSNNPSNYKVCFTSAEAISADSIQFIAAVNVTQNTSARETPVTITFDCNGGYFVSQKTCYAGKTIETAAQKYGYAFMGWYDSADEKVSVVPSAATTLTAKWYDLSKVTNATEETYTDVTLTDSQYYYYWENDGNEESLTHAIETDETVSMESTVAQDFSVTVSDNIKVSAGEKYLLSADVWRDTAASAFFPRLVTKSAIEPETVVEWNAAAVYPTKTNEFETLSSYYEVPDGVEYIMLNFSGNGTGIFKIKNVSLKKVETTETENQADVVSIENDVLKVECDTKTTCVTVTDKRNQKVYKQLNSGLINYSINPDAIKASVLDGLITLKCLDWQGNDFAVLSVGFNPTDAATLDYSVFMNYSAELSNDIYFPQKAVTGEGDYMVLPFNEGMAIDYNDFTTLTLGTSGSWYDYGLNFSQGNWISMPFYGVTNKTSGAGFISIVKDPNDCELIFAKDETNCVGVQWISQKGKFGYTRHLSQTFFTEGGHVAIAKKYREYAKENGTLVTFEQKKAQRGANGAGNIEKLAGAANIWRQDVTSVYEMEKELKAAGLDQLMLSHQTWDDTDSDNLKPVESLVTRYDIYQDVFPSDKADSCWAPVDTTWISEKSAYPNDILVNSDGNYADAWEYNLKDGSGTYTTSALCDKQAPQYARIKIPEELKTKPYSGRFFDTTTTNIRECYSSSHSMTRSECIQEKYNLLAVSSIENKLVTGSETGADYAVPVCDYFEGMMSLAKFRDSDSGGVLDTVKAESEAPDYMLGVQLNEKLRLPLWELVYHDCCVAYWYWGDSNTLYDSDTIYDKRDDFNALYAVPPLYWVSSSENLQRDKERIVKSYKKHSYITKNAFGVEMINHEYLKDDRSVQRTTFANGMQVTVNFNTNTISY